MNYLTICSAINHHTDVCFSIKLSFETRSSSGKCIFIFEGRAWAAFLVVPVFLPPPRFSLLVFSVDAVSLFVIGDEKSGTSLAKSIVWHGAVVYSGAGVPCCDNFTCKQYGLSRCWCLLCYLIQWLQLFFLSNTIHDMPEFYMSTTWKGYLITFVDDNLNVILSLPSSILTPLAHRSASKSLHAKNY
jgi:hypothetical protein